MLVVCHLEALWDLDNAGRGSCAAGAGQAWAVWARQAGPGSLNPEAVLAG